MEVKPLQIPASARRRCVFALRPPRKVIHRELRRQLLERDASALGSWNGVPGAELGEAIRLLARDTVGWPNAFFVPEDPWELLGWDDFDQMDQVELELGAEALIGRRLGRDFWTELPAEVTFGQVVAALIEARETQRGSPRLSLFARIRALLRELLP